MCTAVTYKTAGFYFGRTLDYDCSYSESVTVMPRRFPLSFREMGTRENHYAIIGMAHVADGYPLYYDAMNEKGLAMAGLNFVGNAVYRPFSPGWENIAHFEFIPWILSQCASVSEALERIGVMNMTDEAFSDGLPQAQLHWLLADRNASVTVEVVEAGIRVYPNPAGVLTNNPPFDRQLFSLNHYLNLSPREPENRFSDQLNLKPYSRGMGALGLPGDWSSQSRFIRGAFVKMNALSGSGEEDSVNQFFHILGAVEQSRGCCDLGQGNHEITIYTSCCSADRGIYYYTTYGNHRICAVDMHRENLDGTCLACYPLISKEQIYLQN